MLVERAEAVEEIRWRWSVHPAIAVLGARQCGKSTLARAVAAGEPDTTILDMEDEDVLRRVRDSPKRALERLAGLVVIDEIQRVPRIYETLRVLIDRPGATTRYLLLGSVSPTVVQGVSESLAGRVGYFDLAGFDLWEVAERPEGWSLLWERGGFPRSYLASTTRGSYVWRDEYVRSFLQRDVPFVDQSIPAENLRKYWRTLAHYHGQTWNPKPFAKDIQGTEKDARRYLDLLSGSFVVRILPPWFENLKKRQTRAPKVYVRDSGLLHALLGVSTAEELSAHAQVGASFEGFAIEQIAARAGEGKAFFWRAEDGEELDLLVGRNGRRYGFEMKRTKAPKVTRSMRVALSDLGLERLFVVYPGTERYELDARIEVLPVTDIPTIFPSRHGPIG